MSENAPMYNGARRCSVFLTPAGDDLAWLDGLIRETSAKYDLPPLSLLYAELPLGEKKALARRTLLDRGEFRFDEVKIVTPLNTEQEWRDTMQWQTIYRKKLTGRPAGK